MLSLEEKIVNITLPIGFGHKKQIQITFFVILLKPPVVKMYFGSGAEFANPFF